MVSARFNHNPKSFLRKLFLLIAGPLATICSCVTVGMAPMILSKGRAGAFYSGVLAGICLMLALWIALSLRKGRMAGVPRFSCFLGWAVAAAFAVSALMITFLMMNP